MVEGVIALLDALAGHTAEAGAFHADAIETNDAGGVAISSREWRDVLDDLGAAGQHRILTNVDKLVDCDQA